MAQVGTIVDPALSFQFVVEIEGITAGAFLECNGLEIKTDVFEYKEGGQNLFTHRLAGRTSFTNVTLKRGLAEGPQLYDWYQKVITKKDKSADLKNLSIIQYALDHTEVQRFNLVKAYPVKWSIGGYSTTNNEPVVETFELAFESFSKA
jgi:phage tail-like protein